MESSMIDKILDELIQEAGPRAIEEMEKEDLANLEKHEFEFSQEHEEKMRKIIEAAGYASDEEEIEELEMLDEEGHENSMESTKSVDASHSEEVVNLEERREVSDSNKGHRKFRMSVWKKVLVVAAAMVLVLGIAISSVGAWRESFVKYFLSVKEEYSDVWEDKSDKYCLIDNIYFGYVPKEYEFESKTEIYNDMVINFTNDSLYFSLQIQKNSWFQQINTENGIIKDVVINDKDMVYTQRDDVKILSWSEGRYVYSIYTNDTEEVLFNIAKNIKIVEGKSQDSI